MSKLVITIPALNESKTIGAVIDAIPRNLPEITSIEALVVDDGSTDDTKTIAQHKGAHVISHRYSQGVGGAFHTGLYQALKMGADIIVNVDADGQFDPKDIPALIQPIVNGQADFVTATRFASPEFFPDMPAVKIWGNKWVTRMVNFITGKKFTDVSCGFRAYSRETALRLTLFGKFTYTQETLIDAAFKGLHIVEVPLKIRGEREHGKSRVASNLWRYAAKSGSIMFRAARDYKPYVFFGMPGVVLAIIGVIAGLFLAWHYIQTGQTSPYRSLVTTSGILLIIGFLLMFMSMLADMQHRNRLLLEKILYLARRQAYSTKQHGQA
ncbi:MAG: glycosyltransferase family 2 protein [Candidatus Andersenbacteria bacterium]|nr:glycosyltransferase family 2 protein [Candidatus Andersenbacteria bacterium]